LCEGYDSEINYYETNQQQYVKLANTKYNLSNEKSINSNNELMLRKLLLMFNFVDA
jgi:hypothetical protein